MAAKMLDIVRKRAVLIVSALLLLIGFSGVVYAQCPICVIGAAAGIEVARYFGVDDLITVSLGWCTHIGVHSLG